jgi:mono/diheme cytochrome c family protein
MSAKSRIRTLRWVPLFLVPALIWGWVSASPDLLPRRQSVASDAAAPPIGADRVERGRYLVSTIGCGDCHSPKVMGPNGPVEDTTRLLSGHPEGTVLESPPAMNGTWIAAGSSDLTAWAGPWGISYTFNLTPDENTGIGSWSEDTFVQTIKTGRHMGVSRPILPPMPWQFYRNLTDDDLRSIYAYLRTIPPIHNRVPEPTPPEVASGAAIVATAAAGN